MADQVNPTGSLAPGLPLALLVAAVSRPAPGRAHPAKIADSLSPEQDSRPAFEAAKTPEAAKTLEVAKTLEAAKTPEAAVEQLNRYLQQTGTELKFEVDKATGRTLFKIVSESSGEVLIQVPSEEMLTMARKLRDFEKQMAASGVLVDKEG